MMTLGHSLQQPAPVRSEYADDPDFSELIEFFVDALVERREYLRVAFDTRNFSQLRVVAHQLKGAGGGYGFSELSLLAAELEEACLLEDEVKIAQKLDLLINHTERITV